MFPLFHEMSLANKTTALSVVRFKISLFFHEIFILLPHLTEVSHSPKKLQVLSLADFQFPFDFLVFRLAHINFQFLTLVSFILSYFLQKYSRKFVLYWCILFLKGIHHGGLQWQEQILRVVQKSVKAVSR